MNTNETRRRDRTTLLLALLSLTIPRGALSQSTTLDAFSPSQTWRDGFATSSAQAQGHMRFGAQLYLDYANDPLVYESDAGDASTESRRVVEHHLVGHFGLNLGIHDRLVIYLGLPVSLAMSGDSTAGLGVPEADGTSLGDGYLGARARLYGTTDDVFMLALQATMTVPLADLTSSAQAYSGDASMTFHPSVIAQVNVGKARLVANVGVRIRANQRFLNVLIGDQLTYGLGALVAVREDLDAIVELHGASTMQQFFHRDETPLELLMGIKYRNASGFYTGFAMGPGLVRGFGSPDLRLVLTVGYAPPSEVEPLRLDTDGDGHLDDEDTCPTEPEDVDGFRDDDGCPDPDDDDDGVLDAADACPTDPEDIDAFADDDGCPEDDNDGDTVLDAEDLCPLVAEDRDGFDDTDGCPDPDNDGDEVLDADDRCPLEQGIAAEEGCPEPDRDADTVVDRADNCPDEPGTVENRGCRAAQLVQIEGDRIAIVDNVYFRSNRDVIEARSFPLLDNVASVIAAHPEITRVRVEGHTDALGNRARNVRLSEARARAVVRYLEAHGVATGRLEATGFGPDRPVVPNATTPVDHARNRRVEFHIEGADVRSEDAAPTLPATDR